MSDQIEVRVRLTATNEASPVILQLKRDVDALAASLKKAFSVNVGTELTKSLQRVADQHGEIAGQMRRQVSEMRSARDARRRLNAEIVRGSQISQTAARVHARQQAAALDYDKARLSFGLRMSRQRDRDAAQAGREHQANMRRYGRERAAAGRSALSRGRDGLDRGVRGLDRSTMMAGRAGVVGFGSTALAARKIIMSEIDVDAAEINARIYGDMSKQAARELREKWAAPLSQMLGASTSNLLSSYVEALKVGIPQEGAAAFSELAVKASEAWGIEFKDVVDTLGIQNAILVSAGKKFSITALSSVANTIQYLSAKMATTPQKLNEFLKQGAGGAALLGMSPEAAVAFGAASTSLGNRAFESGRLLDFIGGRIAELPSLLRGTGERSGQMRRMLSQLGYGGIKGLQQAMQSDPDSFVFDLLERFGNIKDKSKRNEAIEAWFGKEWIGEITRLIAGKQLREDAKRYLKEAGSTDAIGEVWSKHIEKLGFAFKQIRAGFLNILGEAGVLLSPVISQIRDTFLGWVDAFRNGGLRNRLAAVGQGLLDGFGYKSLPDMLTGIFGRPGEGDAGSVETWGKAARGFAAGLADVGRSIKALFSALPGGGDTEGIGRWTARILGFSMAARIASPAFDLVAGFGNILLSFASAAMSFMALRKVLGLASLAGGGAAAAAGGGLALTLAGVALVGGALAVAIVNWEGIWNWLKGGPVSKLLRGDLGGRSEEYDHDQAEMQKRLDGARSRGWGWLKRLFGIGEAKAGELPATFRRSADDLRESMDRLGGRVQFASLGGSAASVAGSFSAPAAAAGRAFEIGGSRGMIGNGPINTFGLTTKGIIGGFGGATFTSKAPGVVDQLMRDFNLTREQAAGIVGNLGHESGGFRHMQELNPRGGRGGWGWAQWTGPRRRAFEAWAASNGLDPRSDAANYGFLKHELMTSERGALAAVRRESSVQGATVAFERAYERAGVKHYGSRIAYANQAFSGVGADQRAKQLAAQTPQGLASSVPFTPPPARPGGMFDPNFGQGVSTFNPRITINGANQSPEEIANAVQRRIQEAMNWRTHDVESELT